MRTWRRRLLPRASAGEFRLLLAFAALALALSLPAAARANLAADSLLSLAPPAGQLAWPGTGLALVWTLTNHTDSARTVTFEIVASRSWPLTSTTRGMPLPANETVRFLEPCTVPDTAAAGAVEVFARVHLDGDSTTLGACTSVLTVLEAPAAGVPLVVVSDLVRLEWGSWLCSPFRGIVELQRDGRGWHPEGGVSPDEGGACAFEDRAVTPGSVVEYRLRAWVNGKAMVSAVTTVHVPVLSPLAIAGLRPNPSRGSPVVAFTLAERAATRLEVFDLAGRRVWAGDLGVLAPGPHQQALLPGGLLRSGLYVFRLTSGTKSVSARGVVAN